MDLTNLTTLISSVGFPIVCCVFMAWYINNTMKDFTEIMNRNNTLLEKLITKMGEDDES